MSLALGSIGARDSVIGVASHHHTATIALRETSRSASGVRKEIGSVLQASSSISLLPVVCQGRQISGPLPRCDKFVTCWTKSEIQVMGLVERILTFAALRFRYANVKSQGSGLRRIGDLFGRHHRGGGGAAAG